MIWSKRKQVLGVATMLLFVTALPTAADAKKKGVWSVVATVDPITGRRTCAVSALDRFMGLRFSEVGGLYAVVENNPDAGLLVGVSSGGRWRLPVGNIVWKVDDKLYRTLRAVDNPKVARSGNPALMAAEAAQAPDAKDEAGKPGDDAFTEAYRKTLAATMQQQSAIVAAITATATMASGETARAMLEEMRSGKTLLFRSAAVAPLYGLPSSHVYAVGQETLKGRKPIPIDQSFHDGLVACGIAAP